MSYHAPIKPYETRTAVWIKGYAINNPTTFGPNDIGRGEGQLNLELTFMSNDYSPHKYATFLDEFYKFLNEKGYLQSREF